MQGGDGRLGEANILLVIPDIFVARRLDAEGLPQVVLEDADFFHVAVADINEQHLRSAGDSGILLMVLAASVNDADVKFLFDLAKPRGQRGSVKAIEAGIEDLAAGPQAIFATSIGGPERADKDIARSSFEVFAAGEQSVQDRPDSAYLLDRFVCYVNN